jgi:phosphoglycolate phosphatase
MMVKLVLFDIDGTLIRTGGAGVKAFERTFQDQFGLIEAMKTLKFAGRTDVSLVRECFGQHGIQPSDSNFRQFFDNYPRHLQSLLGTLPGGICEGIEGFMGDLVHANNPPVLGLLTGNIRLGAQLKLAHFGIWQKFATGAFGDDHEDRNCIAAVAKQRGEEILGRTLLGSEIVVIGDTPLDIACGKSIAAKTLAVATGNFTRAELSGSRPDWAVDNLTQVTVTEILGRNGPGIAPTP